MARFGTVLTAMVTPFDDDLALDLDAAAELARWLVANGSDGLVVAATTGEGSVLDDDEKAALWRTVRAAVDVPIVAGSSSNHTDHTVELTRLAAECGADGALIVTPYYNRPSQAGIEAHVHAVASATDLPLMIYDIPIRAGRKISTDSLVRMAHEIPTVVALKDAAANPAETAKVVARTPDDFEVYSGDDDFTLPFLAVGAVGTVGVATHWAGADTRAMIDAFQAGEVETARRYNDAMLSSYEFKSSDETPNPLPAKAMMRAIGHPVGQCRLPMGAAPVELDQRAAALAAELGLKALA
jgi:4-hydroxy-tetrahydrodipicolinate synthase